MPPRFLIKSSVNRSDRSVNARMLTDDAELLGAVPTDGLAENAESGIVDEVFDLHPLGGQYGGNLLAGLGLLEVAWNHDWRRAARGCDFTGQRRQPIRAPRRQGHAMTVRGKNACQLGAYSC